MIIGIDLGTTFSAVAAVNSDGQAEIITNRDGQRTTPSVVMFEDGAVIVGEQAKENSVLEPGNVCQYIKRQMGKKDFLFGVSPTESYTPEEISAMILKRLKEDAEEARGEKAEGAVITVPAYFQDAERIATQNAGEIAGLNVLGIINEPTAAAIAYCRGLSNTDGNVMVYDLGGGTFDITVMNLSDNLRKVTILSTTGNKNLGGFDFDNAIISKVCDEFNEQFNVDLEDDEEAFQDLRIKAENAKKALSTRPKAQFPVVSGGNSMKFTITRQEFEELIRGLIENTKVSMEMALEDAHLEWSDISKILLVGGSTRIPAIHEMIREFTGIEPSHDLNPDEAVAIGAAYYAERLMSNSDSLDEKSENKIEITDVNSHSLGIVSVNNEGRLVSSILIPRNTQLPAVAEQTFRLCDEGQCKIDLQVVEGEDEDLEEDTIIGRAMIEFEPHAKDAPIVIGMLYDENGIVHVKVRDGADNKDLGEMHIHRDANLSSEEINNKKLLLADLNIE